MSRPDFTDGTGAPPADWRERIARWTGGYVPGPDCSGPLADECGGAPAGGDNDRDDGGSHACPWPSDCPARCRQRDCDGADDNPRDCLEA